jgi:hypothetical protein
MLNCRCLCLLAAVPLWGGARQVPSQVALYTQFEHAPSAAVLESMQNEVETIMAPMGAEFEWRALDNVNGNEVSAQLAVVKFQGRCDPSGPGIRMARGRALGWTHVSDGAILPFSDIDCDGIREFTQFGLQAIDGKERAEAYGRALGRVLAHEL